MSSFASAARTTLYRRSSLLQANIGVLSQKLDLMQSLRANLGQDQATKSFAMPCPVVGASVGQHFRHSMDHMERVANCIGTTNNDDKELHYDIRIRGGTDEHDMDAAEERIRKVSTVFSDEIDRLLEAKDIPNTPVVACFLLSGDSTDEFLLSSTIERELGFCAHHAIHHLAMVKIITLQTLELLPSLPEGFGMAPSTIVHEKSSK